jgi:hypothetical protein
VEGRRKDSYFHGVGNFVSTHGISDPGEYKAYHTYTGKKCIEGLILEGNAF